MKGNGPSPFFLQRLIPKKRNLYIEKAHSQKERRLMDEWMKKTKHRKKKKKMSVCVWRGWSGARQKNRGKNGTDNEGDFLRPNDIPLFFLFLFSIWFLFSSFPSFFSLFWFRQIFKSLYPSIYLQAVLGGDTNRMLARNIFTSRWSEGASEVK